MSGHRGPVLHLTRDLAPATTGGISVAVARLMDATARAGWGAAAVSFDAWRPRGSSGRPAREETRGVAPVLRIGDPGHLEAARRWAVERRPALLHVHDAMLWDFADGLRDELAVPALLSAHVVHCRLNEVRGVGERTRSLAAQEAAVASADRVHAPSKAASRWLGSGIVVPFGIDLPPECARDPDGPLLSVGRFDGAKGTGELLDIARQLPRALQLAGGLPASPRAERRWAARIAGHAGVENLGWLDELALQARYRACSAVLLPSRVETFGLAALEAMAWGRPVISARSGGVEDLMAHGVSGLLVPPGDADALLRAARAVLEDDAFADALARGGRESAARLAWPRVLPAWDALYRDLAAA